VKNNIAGIGFRAKTGKAIAVAVSERSAPEFVARWYVDLFDPSVPETSQPHHDVMELPWPKAQLAVRKYEKLIEDVATERLRTLLEELRARGVQVQTIAVVGSANRDLQKIGNPHIRAHAAEGILFRHAIEVAATRCDIASRSFSDRDFDETAAKELRRKPEDLKSVVTTLGRSAGRPWRADERAAATAAWIVA
jgi:hypothetical protein